MKQELLIRGWHPRTSPNGSHGHWSTHQRNHDVDRDMAWASARQAGWTYVPGRVRLTITLVYPRKPVPDPDNAVARCKGLIDGLTEKRYVSGIQERRYSGWFTDDSTEWLDLEVRVVVEKGIKAVRIELEPAGVLA